MPHFLRATVLLLAAAVATAETPEPLVNHSARDAVLDAMAPVIAAGIATRDTDAPIFHGNIDWHSAVHGHWALFRIARATGRHDAEANAADASLSPDLIPREIALLKSDASFEMPYGRSWFLLLAEEFERWSTEHKGADPKRLRGMADLAAASLVAHYETAAPSAASREYENASWAMVRLHGWFTFAGDKDGLAKVAKWIEGMKGLEKPANGFAFDRTHTDFFSRFGNFAYLQVKTRDAAGVAAFLEKYPIRDADITPCVDVNDAAHHLGTNWSRAWSLAALAKAAPEEADRKRFQKAFEAHVERGMKQHAASKDDFWAYGHWVPQFAVYAVTE
ncbi:MAG: DUF2891 domain-containing protein [Planctomycetes bacterium]|nr:DUF2891 domain-containing protein [Planctomycetota bacterium]